MCVRLCERSFDLGLAGIFYASILLRSYHFLKRRTGSSLVAAVLARGKSTGSVGGKDKEEEAEALRLAVRAQLPPIGKCVCCCVFLCRC